MKRRDHHKALHTVAIAACLVVGASSAAYAEEAVLIHSESGGFITLEGESLVRVRGIQGTIAVRTGKEGELRYEVRSLDNRREERPLGLWLNGRAFELGPLEGAAEERLLLDMAVPPGLAVEIDLDDSNVQIAGLRSELLLAGARLDVDARGIHGEVTVEVVESEVAIDGVAGDVEIDSEAIGLVMKRVKGDLRLTLIDSEADVQIVTGQADLDLENTVLIITDVEGGLVLQARGGSVEVNGVKPSVDLRLDGTPLILTNGIGRAVIESDGEVQLDGMKGPINIVGYGGPIIGKGIESAVDLTVDRASIELEEVKGKLTINGNDLGIMLKKVEGETTIRTENSEVRVEGASASLRIENRLGPVEVVGATAEVKVVNQDGDVRLSEIAGPVDVYASGEIVEVGWSEIPGEGNQIVVNERGSIVLSLPSRGRCRIEVQSKYGRISSDIPTVRINADGKFASGVIGGGRGPTIQVRSQGDVHVAGARGGAGEELPTQ